VTVLVSIRRGPFPGISRREVKKWAERMLASLALGPAELSLALTDDREIHELNRFFRKRDKPTDVLAFAMREGEGPPVGLSEVELLGDVVVSVDTARRQAKRRGRSLASELRVLIAHGILHLLGYDHGTDAEARRMGTKTRQLCRAAVRGDAS
jgi:probable rRNA maturation factor